MVQRVVFASTGGATSLAFQLGLAGDVPVDVHGTPSRVIAGDASHYSEVVVPLAG